MYEAALKRPFFILAPMDDVTDTVFRRVVRSCAAPDLFFTEFVNADGLQSPGRIKLLKKLRFTAKEQPLIVQIWGKNPDNFFKTAQQIADGTFAHELGLPGDVNFAGVDLNMGCPQKSEVRNGTCAALMNNRSLAAQLIQATQEGLAGRLPVSVKTRLGFDKKDLSWPEFLLSQNINMLTIHGRTKIQMSKVPADWEAIGHIRELRDRIAPSTLIIGNGDVKNKQHGLQLAKAYKLDGIMVGRGILHDPFAFASKSSWGLYTKKQKLELYQKHVKLFNETWKREERPVYTLNKFCKIYVNGFDEAKELREQMMKMKTIEALLDSIEKELQKLV
jgi:tRNA-dihydrouridine synthase